MSSKPSKTNKNIEKKTKKSVSQKGKPPYKESINSPVYQILFIQQTMGNQAVQRLFNSGQIQAKLKISQPNDIYEREADRVAEQVVRMPENKTISSHQSGIRKKKESIQLLEKEESTFQKRGNNFFQPISSPIGQILCFQRTIGNQAIQRLFKSGVIQAKPENNQTTSGNPTFSVNQQNYQRLVERAVQNIGGPLVAGKTLARNIQPMLQAMLTQVTWRDSGDIDHGGSTIQYTLPGTQRLVLNLRLVLYDKPNPLEAGKFVYSGTTDGTIFVYIQRSSTTEELTEVLFHESLHMISWIINQTGGRESMRAAQILPSQQQALRALLMSRFSYQINLIRPLLDRLAQSVNSRRIAARQDSIPSNRLDQMAKWLMEEVQVYAETEVFQKLMSVQQERHQRAQVYTPTHQYGRVNTDMVDNYVFDFSKIFVPADRTGLTSGDRKILRDLTDKLEGFYQRQVRSRFSLTSYTKSVSSESFPYRPRPLQRPSFIERIPPTVERPPF